MFQVGNGHFIAKMICIARIPQQYMYIMKRVNTGAQTYMGKAHKNCIIQV